jgi:ribosomal protein S20
MGRTKNAEMLEIKVDQMTRKFKQIKQQLVALTSEKNQQIKQLRAEIKSQKSAIKVCEKNFKSELKYRELAAYQQGFDEGLCEAQVQMDTFIKQLEKEAEIFEKDYLNSAGKKTKSKTEVKKVKIAKKTAVKTTQEQVAHVMEQAQTAIEEKIVRSAEPSPRVSEKIVIESA